MEKKIIFQDLMIEFDFELSLRDRLNTIWEALPCVWPLDLCKWKEYADGDLGVINEED